MSAWEMDLSGHNHRHLCIVCGAITWHEGTKAECMVDLTKCVDCLEDEDDDSHSIH